VLFPQLSYGLAVPGIDDSIDGKDFSTSVILYASASANVNLVAYAFGIASGGLIPNATGFVVLGVEPPCESLDSEVCHFIVIIGHFYPFVCVF